MNREHNKSEKSRSEDGVEGACPDQDLLPGERCCCSGLQRLAHPYVFGFLVFLVNLLQGGIASGTGGGALSTIEKRFQLKSSELAPFLIVNDIISVIMVVFVSYYGHTSHRPRLVAGGCLLIGVGLLLCTLPQFIYDTPPQFSIGRNENGTAEDSIYPICQKTEATPATCTDEEERNSGSLMWQVALIIVGQILYGLGTSPTLSLSVTYMDDALDRTSTSVFVAFSFIATALGPLLGFGISGACLSTHADFYKGPVSATIGDPNFLGAWWLIYAIFGILIIIAGLPILFFPKAIRRRAKEVKDAGEEMVEVVKEVEAGTDREEVEDENDNGADLYRLQVHKSGEGKLAYVKGFLEAIRRLVTNLTFMAVVFGVCAILASLSGNLTFMAKYLETQFSLSASTAPMIFGIILTPGAIIGNLIGGFVVRTLKLTTKGMARMVVIVLPFLFLLAPAYLLLGCDNRATAGITFSYPNMTGTKLPNLDAECNADCACPTEYTPICGSDGVTYATPCHAGCLAKEIGKLEGGDGGNITIFTDCGCIGPNSPADPLGLSGDYEQVAIEGECASDCSTLIPFIITMVVGSTITTTVGNPGFMLQLRSVDHDEFDDRSVAVGFTTMALRLLGFIPAPIIFGAVIDTACSLFQSSCGITGNCLVYDIVHFRFAFNGMSFGFFGLSFLMFLVSYLSIRETDQTKDLNKTPEVNGAYNANSSDDVTGADDGTDQTMGALEHTNGWL